MKFFFACKRRNSSSNNLLSGRNLSPQKKEEKNDKESLLLSKDNIIDTTYNLEIIDYPYSINNNDDKTVTMNSDKKKMKTKNKVTALVNNINPQYVLKDEIIDNEKIFNNHFYTNSSQESSGIINNEDNVAQNKMLLNNYYINYNIIHFNGINDNEKKEGANMVSNKSNKNKNKINENANGIKVEYQNPDSETFFKKSNNNKFDYFLNKNVANNKNSVKKFKKKIKNNNILNINKTIEIKRNVIGKNKSKKTIELNSIDTKKILKNNSNYFDTYHIYNNNISSSNNIKEKQIHRDKLKNKKNKKVEAKKYNVIKSIKVVEKNNTSKILNHKKQTIQQKIIKIEKKKPSIIFLKKTIKSKPMYSSNTNLKSPLLIRMNKELDSLKNSFSINKNNIIKKLKTKKIFKKKVINKNICTNPFNTIDLDSYRK